MIVENNEEEQYKGHKDSGWNKDWMSWDGGKGRHIPKMVMLGGNVRQRTFFPRFTADR